MNSSDAPPPVLTWSTSSARPICRMAAALSPPPTTVKPGELGDRLGDGAGAGRERRELEHAHRAVPQHGRRARELVGVQRGGLGADVEALPPVGDRARGHDARLRVVGRVRRDHDVGGNPHPAGVEQPPALVDHLGLARASRRRGTPARRGT